MYCSSAATHDVGHRHVPVLRDEVMEYLRPAPGVQCVDCTLGLGGHSAALMARGATVLGIDRDPVARLLATRRLACFGDRFRLYERDPVTYADAVEDLVAQGEQVDGILADLGVSSMQLDNPRRGFSLRSPALADMRMGDGCQQTALEVIDACDEEQLADLIHRLGEERASRRVARALKRAREQGVDSAAELAAVVARAVPGRHPRHPAQRTFQALRMAINDELGQLVRLLKSLPALLHSGGRAVIIAFHSLEDRLVKRALRAYHKAGLMRLVSRSVVVATATEIATNRRSASAKLRWGVRA